MKKLLFFLTLLLLLLLVPFILWQLNDDVTLNIAIIDKTVPNEDYREHQGIVWFLNHQKYKQKDGQAVNKITDYFGVHPNISEKKYEASELPYDYSDYDTIYLADSYGVYEDDTPWNERERKGARSNLIHGGLTETEWSAIVDRLNQNEKSLFIAEFNSFASPTEDGVRQSMTDLLGVEWSGWVGRYFDELDYEKNIEIPQWIVDQYGDNWNYTGEGFLLVNDLTYETVVLELNKHVMDKGISITFTDEGQKKFDITKQVKYNYWFDIIVPKSHATVYATYDWQLTNEGKELLTQHHIPTEFAAVVSSTYKENTSYYFAGDFNDIGKVPFLYQFKWLPQFYKFTNAFSDDAFYWSVYIPLMKEILAEHVHKEVNVADENKETTYHARIHQNQYEIWMNDTWQPMTLKGVNMGIAKPGYFPGETAITEEEYFQWFTQIGELNANVIRVYTLHPPDFYRALKRYNEQYEQKLYLIHGVWADEEPLEKLLDAFNESIVTNFQGEINKIVDAIHGNTIIEHQPGHASGVYSDDISEYVIGWILGIEWSPFMVEHTNQVHKGLEDFQGNYFETKNAEPFEIWLAQQMETIFAYELETYQSIRPISFTNWPTTDILDHPSDATENEDFASVDPNVIYTKNEAELTGQFASYHVYPYYPDFLNFDEKYTSYVDHRGEKNNYAGYLNELRDAHRLPILIAEFGVPASRGLTHENIYGWNQGFLTEKEQGDIVVRLYEDILAEGLMGGILFTWQDEWFKRTWNTMDYDNPDRRPYWSNAQTNEQQFGILSFDRHKIKVDGQTDDWEQEPIYQKNEGILKSLTMDHDERYVYFKIELNETGNGYPAILLDTLPNQGNNQISFLNDWSFQNGIEFFIRLNREQPRILIDQYYDQFTYQYGYLLEMIEVPEEQPKNNSGQFIPMHYALNKEYYNPEKEEVYEFSSYETGYLRHGNGNPESAEYDSLADYYFNEKKGIVELRIPWLLLQAKDPSRKEFTGNVYENGIEASEFIEQIFVGLLFIEDNEVVDTLPQSEDGKVREFKHYTWDNWELPQYESRLKQSYDIIQELFKSIDKK